MTAILYTSSPWDEGDGGSLRLWPPRQAVQWGSSHQQRGVIEIQDLRSGGSCLSAWIETGFFTWIQKLVKGLFQPDFCGFPVYMYRFPFLALIPKMVFQPAPRSHTNRYEENGDRHIDGNGHSNCNGHLAADDLSSRASTGSSISSLEAGEWICRREGCACQQTSSCELRLSCICPLMRRWDTMSFATKGRTVSASQLKRGFGLGRRRFGTVAALH